MSFTAGSVMNGAGALLNDVSLTEFSYTVQIPYLNIALGELQELFQENNIPVTNARSAVLSVPTGTTTISFGGTPALPADLTEIQKLGERNSGTNDDFTEMIKKEFLPMTEVLTIQLVYWSWIGDVVTFLGATSDRDVEMDYIASIFTPITAFSDVINIIGGQTYLTFEVASLCAWFVGENEERSLALHTKAETALNRALNIPIKGKQSIVTRRRPFMASFRNRGSIIY